MHAEEEDLPNISEALRTEFILAVAHGIQMITVSGQGKESEDQDQDLQGSILPAAVKFLRSQHLENPSESGTGRSVPFLPLLSVCRFV